MRSSGILHVDSWIAGINEVNPVYISKIILQKTFCCKQDAFDVDDGSYRDHIYVIPAGPPEGTNQFF